jgi:hypothetical protein
LAAGAWWLAAGGGWWPVEAAAAIDVVTALRDGTGLAVRPVDFGIAEPDFAAIGRGS